MLKNYFSFVVPSALAKQLYATKAKKKNNKLVEEIKNRWSNLKDEIKKMSEDGKKIEKPDKILKIVKEILDFNKEIKTMRLRFKNFNTKCLVDYQFL